MQEKIENYRPVGILNGFSKIYEMFLVDKFKPCINTYLSQFIAAYRENYSSSHDWKTGNKHLTNFFSGNSTDGFIKSF